MLVYAYLHTAHICLRLCVFAGLSRVGGRGAILLTYALYIDAISVNLGCQLATC